MHLDANSPTFSERNVHCDIAIVGAGPAGITLAQQFKNTAYSVCLLESGGLENNVTVQALSRGTRSAPSPAVESEYISQHSQRLFGGTGSVWGGFCREMDAVDFEQRHLGFDHQWPITLNDLAPYYPWNALEKKYDRQPIANSTLELRHFEKLTYPFHVIHQQEFAGDANITVLLNSTVINLPAQQHNRIDHLDVVNSASVEQTTQVRFQVKAKAYVLACGGIGNVKLLLNANGLHQHGLGNAQDQVGRYFMEHPHFQFYDAPALLWMADTQAPWWHVDARYKPALFFNEDILREQQLLNFCAMVSASFDEAPGLKGANLYRPKFSPLSDKPGSFHSLAFRCEQRPNPDSRVTLSDEHDALGLRQVHLDWQLTHEDKQSLIRNIHLLANELGKASLGRMRLLLDEQDIWRNMVGGGHLMGTTRMGTDKRNSVVNADCQLHDVDNVFIAGSSVFATSGVTNPTLTLMALARRLGAHLKNII